MEQLSSIALAQYIKRVLQEDRGPVRPLLGNHTKKLIDCEFNEFNKEVRVDLKSLLSLEIKQDGRHLRPLFFSNESYEFLGLQSRGPQIKLTQASCIELLKFDEELFIFSIIPFDRCRPWKNWDLPEYLLCEFTLIYDKKKNHLRIQCLNGHDNFNGLSFTKTTLAKDSPSMVLSAEQVNAKQYHPTENHWNEFIQLILKELRDSSSALTKVVAARTEVLEFDHHKDGPTLFSNIKSDSRYHFYLESDFQIFMGNTPECLIAAKEGNYYFDALAGTRPRSENPIEDKRLEDELVSSLKEQYEHEQVVNYITDGLDQYGEVSRGSSTVLKLKTLQHIKTPLGLKTRENSPEILLELIDRLHPTPAVCGMPKFEAMNFLKNHDPIDRGMYAGAIGILNQKYSDLCVGIRSLLLQKDAQRKSSTVTLFGGAGIVADSIAQQEWEETGNKIKSFFPFKEVHL